MKGYRQRVSHLRQSFGISRSIGCRLVTFVYRRTLPWCVIQFGRRDLQGKLQSLKWFVGGKSDKQFKRRFGRTYHKMPKSRPTIHTGYKLRRQEVFRLRKTQRCLVKTSETCQRSLFAVPVKLSCSLNYESYTYFFSKKPLPTVCCLPLAGF